MKVKHAQRNLLAGGGELVRIQPKGDGRWDVEEVEQQAV